MNHRQHIKFLDLITLKNSIVTREAVRKAFMNLDGCATSPFITMDLQGVVSMSRTAADQFNKELKKRSNIMEFNVINLSEGVTSAIEMARISSKEKNWIFGLLGVVAAGVVVHSITNNPAAVKKILQQF